MIAAIGFGLMVTGTVFLFAVSLWYLVGLFADWVWRRQNGLKR